MTKEQLAQLVIGQRVSMMEISLIFGHKYIYGQITKIYNGNYQVQVKFDLEKRPRVIGYSQLELINS